MKTIFIFSNPFGYGPGGKAHCIAKHICDRSQDLDVVFCGNSHLKHLIGESNNKLRFREVDERNEKEIFKIIKEIKGEKYIISSQNRFAINVAHRYNIPCAFLDGLSWFWKKIPDDHFLADQIFWLNYPGIRKRIPQQFSSKISIVHGISDDTVKATLQKRSGVLMYVGGCKNPLTPLPRHYLDLIAVLIKFAISKGINIDFATDLDSQSHLKKYPHISKIINAYSHDQFISKLSSVSNFISNGGQTATLEAANLHTQTSFFLPINLSQFALVENLTTTSLAYPSLKWNSYTNIPPGLEYYSEKDAISFFDNLSEKILGKKAIIDLLCDDFVKMMVLKKNKFSQTSFLQDIGSNGAEDIYMLLKDKWDLS